MSRKTHHGAGGLLSACGLLCELLTLAGLLLVLVAIEGSAGLSPVAAVSAAGVSEPVAAGVAESVVVPSWAGLPCRELRRVCRGAGLKQAARSGRREALEAALIAAGVQ